MAHNKSSPGIVTAALPDSDVSWLDLVFQMDNWTGDEAVLTRWPLEIQRHVLAKSTVPERSFGLEVTAATSEALEAACKELGDDIGQPGVAREVIARRIIATAKLCERDPVRLQAASLRKSAAAKIRESGRGNSLPLTGTHSKQ